MLETNLERSEYDLNLSPTFGAPRLQSSDEDDLLSLSVAITILGQLEPTEKAATSLIAIFEPTTGVSTNNRKTYSAPIIEIIAIDDGFRTPIAVAENIDDANSPKAVCKSVQRNQQRSSEAGWDRLTSLCTSIERY